MAVAGQAEAARLSVTAAPVLSSSARIPHWSQRE